MGLQPGRPGHQPVEEQATGAALNIKSLQLDHAKEGPTFTSCFSANMYEQQVSQVRSVAACISVEITNGEIVVSCTPI